MCKLNGDDDDEDDDDDKLCTVLTFVRLTKDHTILAH